MKESQNMNNQRSATIVIPTFNEAETIGVLIEQLYRNVFPLINDWRMNILVVDGSSPDGTGNIVNGMIPKFNGLYLIQEKKKEGIGSAYLKGFRYAMDVLHTDAVIEFDADFQHPPETIAGLIRKLDEGYDYVIGSRKIAGGSEPANRNVFRLAFTNFGGWLARFILFFPGKYFFLVTDPTTGLKITRVKGCLDKLNLDESHLYSKKFGYKVQLFSETLATGARYAEIPLNFQNRLAGHSKFEAGTAKDILIVCLKTRVGR